MCPKNHGVYMSVAHTMMGGRGKDIIPMGAPTPPIGGRGAGRAEGRVGPAVGLGAGRSGGRSIARRADSSLAALAVDD